MQTANHILAQEGILTSFSIAKKVTPKDVKRLRSKLGTDLSTEQLREALKQTIVSETKQAIKDNQIPGILFDETPPINPPVSTADDSANVPSQNQDEKENEDEKKRIMRLTYYASLISKQITDKKISKYHSCYIINAIVNMLGITEEDFDEFHRKFSKYRDGNTESDDSDI